MMLKIIKNSCAWLSRRLSVIAYLTAENLALRQQLIVLNGNQRRPKSRERDRLFWVVLSRIWTGWRDALLIVQPDTVIRWHKRAFKLYWRRKSRTAKRGRPAMDSEVRALILKMADANPTWGAPKIHGELLALGIVVSERAVSNLLRRHRRKPPSQTWWFPNICPCWQARTYGSGALTAALSEFVTSQHHLLPFLLRRTSFSDASSEWI